MTVVNALPPVRLIRAGRARRARWPIVLVLVWAALAVADLAVFHSGLGSHAAAESAVKPGMVVHRHTVASAPARAARKTARTSARVFVPVSASAFGPGGSGSGDNPQIAGMAVDASTATAWTTHWYRTAQFGGLQTGTGLLIDMGRRVRITRVRIILGAERGADLQLLTGNVPVLTRLRLQASAGDAGGTLRLKLARPDRVRYLLIWFTSLPPDSSGTFQASVYNVRIYGRVMTGPLQHPAG